MRTHATGWSLGILPLVLVLMSAPGAAWEPPRLKRQPVQRNLHLSKDPSREVPEVFVAARTVTTLRFEHPCDPSQTKLLGWEGRFEPLLVGGKSVVIVPLQDLAPDDRFFLLVTLANGTALPFTVAAGKDWVDGQVDVFPSSETLDAVRVALEEKREENQSLRAENQRYRQEETSVDHALATLLANNQVALTPFKLREKWTLRGKGLKADVTILDGPQRAAVVFAMTNLDPQKPWKLEEARLTSASTSEEKPFALRMSSAAIAPGKTGRIAVITDIASFASKEGTDRLVLELFRDGGLRQGYVLLEQQPRSRR